MNDFEKMYAGSGKRFFFGLGPVECVEHILRYKKSGDAFEMGFGEGRNLFFLAENGFYCKGIDTSKTGLSKCEHFASQHQLPIHVELGDICNYSFDRNYDVVISAQVFQFLRLADIYIVVETMKKHTTKNGLNVIASFTDRFNTSLQGYSHLFKQGELESLYSGECDWKIIETKYSETPVHTHPGDAPHKHEMVYLIAMKL